MYGKRLNNALERRGFEPADAIKKTGISASTFYKRLRETDLPTDFIDTVCEAMNIPRQEVYFSAEELASLSGVNPVVSPIVEELDYAAEHYPKTVQAHLFGGILAQLKKSREMIDGGEWR